MNLFLYTSDDGMKSILKNDIMIVSTPWSTNDITEGVAQNSEKQSEKIRLYGYICMSETATSPAMWGYYADRSRGACLAFEFPDSPCLNGKFSETINNVEIKFSPIQYKEERSTATDVLELLSVKSDDWKHEKEYRLFFRLSDLTMKPITKDGITKEHFVFEGLNKYLSTIILGANCPSQCAEIIAITHKKYKVCRIEFDKKNFEFSGIPYL